MPYEELLSGMEKAELLAKAVMLGHLLVRVDETNPMWHGMYADTLIVKGKLRLFNLNYLIIDKRYILGVKTQPGSYFWMLLRQIKKQHA